MKVFVFGSDYGGDSIAFKVAEDLKHEKEHDFIYSNDPTDLMYEKNLVIMDACKDLKKARIFRNVSDLAEHNICSLHDFDLGYFLRLANNMGMKKKVTIIGLPMDGDYNKIRDDAIDLLQELKGSSVRSLGRLLQRSLHF